MNLQSNRTETTTEERVPTVEEEEPLCNEKRTPTPTTEGNRDYMRMKPTETTNANEREVISYLREETWSETPTMAAGGTKWNHHPRLNLREQ